MWTECFVKDRDYSDINPMLYGYESVPPDRAWGNLAKNCWSIHYVASGCGTYIINGKTYKVTPGHLFVIPPFVKVTYISDHDDPWSYMWLNFTTKKPLPIELDDVIYLPKARAVFVKAKDVFDYTEGAAEFLVARIFELFSLIIESRAPKSDPMQLAVDFMRSKFASIKNISEVADEIHLDRCYFSVAFKKHTGMSPAQFLLNHRMQVATEMLNERLKIATVAHSVGYNDTFVFSKAFKRHFGISPKQYVINLSKV